MKVIELHVNNSGSPICIPLSQIEQVSVINDHAYVVKASGNEVEVRETYQEITRRLQELE